MFGNLLCSTIDQRIFQTDLKNIKMKIVAGRSFDFCRNFFFHLTIVHNTLRGGKLSSDCQCKVFYFQREINDCNAGCMFFCIKRIVFFDSHHSGQALNGKDRPDQIKIFDTKQRWWMDHHYLNNKESQSIKKKRKRLKRQLK